MTLARVLAPVCLILFSVSPAWSALGDSIETVFKSYGSGGERIYFAQSAEYRRETIRWAHIFSPDIVVFFENGIAYRVRVDGNLSPSKWNYYLEANASGHRWTLTNWVEGDHPRAEWRRDDGAQAYYAFQVMDLIDAPHANVSGQRP